MANDIIDGGYPGSAVIDVIDGSEDTDEIIDGNDAPSIPAPPVPLRESRIVSLESFDGSIVLPLTGRAGRILLPGATGLELPPIDVVRQSTPGMPGGWLEEINVLERPIFLPVAFHSIVSQAEFFAKLAELREVVTDWDNIEIGQTGTFRLVVSSLLGERVLDVTYTEGWDAALGTNSGSDWEKFGLNLVAVAPYWRQRNPLERNFSLTPGKPFLGDGSGANPWPRRLSSSVAGSGGLRVTVDGDVSVWPELEVTGPVASAGISYPGTSVMIPLGLSAGETLTLITDPRARSARLGGQIAWDQVNYDATFSPLRRGDNRISMLITGASDDAAIRIRWTPQWKAAY